MSDIKIQYMQNELNTESCLVPKLLVEKKKTLTNLFETSKMRPP